MFAKNRHSKYKRVLARLEMNSSENSVESDSGGTGNRELDEVIELAGYAYDPKQDIFYSTMDPWQREIGYCRLYDEAAAPMGMIIDCEPIYFDYQGKKWVVELWKGQYDLVTGCEIGVYTQAFNLSIPGIFSWTFFKSASNTELLKMSCKLKKNGHTLFKRTGKHWWLTGFKLGEFSEPSELKMKARIALHNTTMRDAFLTGLRKAGYASNELKVENNTVTFIFDVPRTAQPMTRNEKTDRLIQMKNKELCDLYQEITGPYDNVRDKLKAIEEHSPDLYGRMLKIGKTKKMYKVLTMVTMIGSYLLSAFTGEKPKS